MVDLGGGFLVADFCGERFFAAGFGIVAFRCLYFGGRIWETGFLWRYFDVGLLWCSFGGGLLCRAFGGGIATVSFRCRVFASAFSGLDLGVGRSPISPDGGGQQY